jgi:hypothetical protein
MSACVVPILLILHQQVVSSILTVGSIATFGTEVMA